MADQYNSNFVVLNLASQAEAVARHVEGWSKERILGWLSHQGELRQLTDTYGKEYFNFNSKVGFEVGFYLNDDEFLFTGDHTIWKPKR